MEMFSILINKIKKNWSILFIFTFLGFFLALMGFNLDKESYLYLFSTVATIVATLIGFIGIFVVYKLQNIQNNRSYYIDNVNNLKNKIKIYKFLLIEYQQDKIERQLTEINRWIEVLGRKIDSGVANSHEVTERQTAEEIKYNLELIRDNIKLEIQFSPDKDSFLVAIYGIFFFMIPIALNHINFSNPKYMLIFNNWEFMIVKMSFTWLLFGLFFIILKDLTNMLKQFLQLK